MRVLSSSNTYKNPPGVCKSNTYGRLFVLKYSFCDFYNHNNPGDDLKMKSDNTRKGSSVNHPQPNSTHTTKPPPNMSIFRRLGHCMTRIYPARIEFYLWRSFFRCYDHFMVVFHLRESDFTHPHIQIHIFRTCSDHLFNHTQTTSSKTKSDVPK